MHAHEHEWRQAVVCWSNADGEEPLNNDAECSLMSIPSKICSTFRNFYVVLDVTVVCYCCIIIVLSSLLSCVLPSVRVIGKEYQRAHLSELSRIPHRPKSSRIVPARRVKHKAWYMLVITLNMNTEHELIHQETRGNVSFTEHDHEQAEHDHGTWAGIYPSVG